ncbi:MAG: hypothetical protein SPI77_03225 [Corynebacterium sp.]|nr:hypothetical protein [Corynebacterium sp.]
MGIFDTFTGSNNRDTLSHAPTNPREVEKASGPAVKTLLTALDRTVTMQSGMIGAYLDWLRKPKKGERTPQTPADVQAALDKHFRSIASGTGATTGAAAAIPGLGLVSGVAAVSADSLLFLDAAAVYTMASAVIRGADIDDPEQRRALLMVVLAGASGSPLVDTILGDLGDGAEGLSTAALLTRFSGPKLNSISDALLTQVRKKITRKLSTAWLGKLIPLGIGAVVGTLANRKLAGNVIESAHAHLGALPASFADIDRVIDGEVIAAELSD